MGHVLKFKRANVKPEEEVFSFYLYDYAVLDDPQSNGKLGGVKIIERGGEKVVKMTNEQARYWLDQSVIGTTPRADRSTAMKKLHEQSFEQHAEHS